MLIIKKNEGYWVTIIKVRNDYLYLKDVLSIFIVYLLLVNDLLKSGVTYRKRFWVRSEISNNFGNFKILIDISRIHFILLFFKLIAFTHIFFNCVSMSSFF